VTPTKDAEEDPLLAEFQGTEKIFQWHSETFDLPTRTTHLAFSPICANQVFRYGGNIYGFQFHLEVDEPMIERWLRVVENRREIASLGGKIDPAAIRRDTPLHLTRLQQLGNQVFGEFIRLFE
jgi:GMP synthase (glutamine-hydrolysing)